MTLEIIRNVGQWKRAGAREGGERDAPSNIPSGPGQLSLRGTFQASESKGDSYYWLQMILHLFICCILILHSISGPFTVSACLEDAKLRQPGAQFGHA